MPQVPRKFSFDAARERFPSACRLINYQIVWLEPEESPESLLSFGGAALVLNVRQESEAENQRVAVVTDPLTLLEMSKYLRKVIDPEDSDRLI